MRGTRCTRLPKRRRHAPAIGDEIGSGGSPPPQTENDDRARGRVPAERMKQREAHRRVDVCDRGVLISSDTNGATDCGSHPVATGVAKVGAVEEAREISRQLMRLGAREGESRDIAPPGERRRRRAMDLSNIARLHSIALLIAPIEGRVESRHVGTHSAGRSLPSPRMSARRHDLRPPMKNRRG